MVIIPLFSVFLAPADNSPKHQTTPHYTAADQRKPSDIAIHRIHAPDKGLERGNKMLGPNPLVDKIIGKEAVNPNHHRAYPCFQEAVAVYIT